MTGRVCLITGSTGGIGRAAALALARLGATAILVARDRARGEAALAAVRAASPAGRGDLLVADLSSQAEVRRLAGEVAARHSALHVLVNNAGAIYGRRETTVDGIERTLATNHLASFLLTALLLDRLQASAPARVVTVSSDAHFGARLDLDHLEKGRYRSFRAYKQSKLANILFTRELARRLAGRGVTANCLHPGVVATGFARGGSALFRLGFRLATPFMLTPEQGADTIVYLASAPEVAEVSGEYFERRRIKRPSAAAEDAAAGRRLWEISGALTGLTPARPSGA
jgi:retinol dehydrogenase-12